MSFAKAWNKITAYLVVDKTVQAVERCNTEGELLTCVCAYDEALRLHASAMPDKLKDTLAARVHKTCQRLSPW